MRSSFVGLLPRPSIFPKLSILLEWLEKEIWFGVGYGGVGRVLELVCCTSSGGMGCAEKSTRMIGYASKFMGLPINFPCNGNDA